VLLSIKRIVRAHAHGSGSNGADAAAVDSSLLGCLNSGDIRDRIGLLSGHPFAEIATHAAELETLVDRIGLDATED
jgi:hypothetical protein